ncbi:MAG: hypothetical protein ACFFCW_48775, partial [Candidatus Hodarchaeota archaeon]
GRMPVEIMVDSKKEKGYFGHDVLVHPEHRKGLGLYLYNRLLAMQEDITDTFTIHMWMNEITHMVLARRGYHELKGNTFVKFLNPRPAFRKRLKNKFLIQLLTHLVIISNNLFDFLFQNNYRNISLSQIKRFDKRFDSFVDEISKKFGLITMRHHVRLNWAYVNKPGSDFIFYIIEREKKLAGYIVLRIQNDNGNKEGIIVDLLTDPDDPSCIDCLCQIAINYFKKMEVNAIYCFLTNKRFIKIFKKHLFIKAPSNSSIMIGNLHKHPNLRRLLNIDNWFLTYGDSDRFAWILS